MRHVSTLKTSNYKTLMEEVKDANIWKGIT